MILYHEAFPMQVVTVLSNLIRNLTFLTGGVDTTISLIGRTISVLNIHCFSIQASLPLRHHGAC